MKLFLTAFLILGSPTLADVLVPLRTIRAKEIISSGDIAVKPVDVPGALSEPSAVIGKEARVALYAGRPLRPGDVGPPALIDRNEIVSLLFKRGGLEIMTEGRALDRAAAGETVRVMNLSSRTTITGFVRADGSIEVR